jgi:phenylalanyl-tRNA synthetase beta chain
MPVIEVNTQDFRDLLGRDIQLSELRDRLPMMGTSWEGETEDGFALEIFPNRPDLLSLEGLVRAYASWTGAKKGLIDYYVHPSDYKVNIDQKTQEVRPYFVTAVIKNVEFDDALIRSLIQMQEKLHVTHGRRRRKVAIGIHDLNPIGFPVKYTTKPPNFKFQPLGEKEEYDLTWILTKLKTGKEYAWIVDDFKEYPMITDMNGMVLSMPPIINGEYTRVDEFTAELFIDVTGTDIKAVTEVLNVICTTMADRGAEIYEVHNYYPDGSILITPNLRPWEMELDNRYVNATLGVDFTPEESAEQLEKMGYNAQTVWNIIKVNIPCYRADIMHPIDLVEDIAIAYGYDNFEPNIPPLLSEAGEDELEIFCRNLRNFLVGHELLEVVTFMMTNKEKLFTKMCIPKEQICETENPKMEAYTSLRSWLLPSLIEILSFNKHHQYPQNLYEIDDIVVIDQSTMTGAKTKRRLAIVQCHAKANFSDIKALMNSILENLELNALVEPSGWDCFIDGRRYVAKIGDEELCWAGEIKPKVLENWSIEMPVAALEMDIDILFKNWTKS